MTELFVVGYGYSIIHYLFCWLDFSDTSTMSFVADWPPLTTSPAPKIITIGHTLHLIAIWWMEVVHMVHGCKQEAHTCVIGLKITKKHIGWPWKLNFIMSPQLFLFLHRRMDTNTSYHPYWYCIRHLQPLYLCTYSTQDWDHCTMKKQGRKN
jgi:hypothetical protein